MDTAAQEPGPRTLVLCLDGTGSEPESGVTNVARIYAMAVKDDRQLVFYDPGVGTMGARGAVTPFGAWLTRTAGLIVGYGIRDNIADAYSWLMAHYRDGDRIMLFGFSRGAYTAVALAGVLRSVGLLRPGAENLVPYALKMALSGGGDKPSETEEQAFWRTRSSFDDGFGNPAFRRFGKPVTFLGVWDTVKSVGWFNLRARFEQVRWPFTRNVDGVRTGRLALALDENRRAFTEYRFGADKEGVRVVDDPRRDLQEMWFAGVHSDIGGQYEDDHGLSDISLEWMTAEAVAAGLRIDPRAYDRLLGVTGGAPVPAERAEGRIHRHQWYWAIAGLGWRRRHPARADQLHPSVQRRVDATAASARPYRVAWER
ncbi:DUF2235 domain-containing protein [Microbacterium jejuense]|uniref:DUF2235 domain-containing protein n=1 Tax=Microbacterium jejuense TaxID=1263637 RepID=A0ABS7HQU8_9MICO|nr:DUF2235 domain-containing protein [Microbacterium jejuense]MBW9095344.1 DUF2235 domain-containing protein [Microbacterium jejuense]